MRQFTENSETKELLNELEANEIEYEAREQNKIFIDITNGDTLEGVWSVQWYDYWNAYKMVYYYLEDNEIQEAKTVAFNIQQVIENVLAD